MADRLLLRGGTVLTVDPDLGDLPTGDVLIEGDTIAQVAPQIDADAEVLDMTGRILVPGFVDTHRHTWEAPIRGCAPNATLDDYFVEVLDTFAPVYTNPRTCTRATWPVHWSARTRASPPSSTGPTSTTPPSIRTPRSRHSARPASAPSTRTAAPTPRSLDYWNNSKIAIPADDVRRVRDTYFSSGDGLLTMALATRGPTYCTNDVVRNDGRHLTGDPPSRRTVRWEIGASTCGPST